jgi:regulator of nucleoside diphosphate kinase
MKQNEIYITDIDRRRLGTLVERAVRNGLADREIIADLEEELERASAVDAADCPDDIVTMNSAVRLRDVDRNELQTVKLVYPIDANVEENRVSVLSPLGTALIGTRVGQIFETSGAPMRGRLRVEKVVPA